MNPSLKQIHDWIRHGKGEKAREALLTLAQKKVPAADLAPFANLAWRSGLADLGARVLNRVVRGDARRVPAHPDAAQAAEYAVCLVKLGASREGGRILDGITPELYPGVLLYRAFARIAEWEYAEAIPLLKSYLEQRGVSRYQRFVGKINLASALVYERQYLAAEGLLRELLHEASVRGYTLALGVLLEYSAANFIWQRKLSKAGPLIEAAAKFDDKGGTTAFFIAKWKRILAFTKSPKTRISELDMLRREALKYGHWETIRDCDRFQALYLKERQLLSHLYFGTPYRSFRRRLLLDYGVGAKLPDEWNWNLGKKAGPEFHVGSGKSGNETLLKPQQLLHRLLLALSSDFYRPFRVEPLHYALYPKEFFNPFSSPARVHVAIQRLRRLMMEARVPIGIDESDGAYRLVAESAVTLVLPNPDHGVDTSAAAIHLEGLKMRRDFSVSEAIKLLDLPRRSVQRLLQEGHKEGWLSKHGAGPATRYHWKKHG